ncbi:MAG: NifB/NifX family molybdenum-iron cluster-binding protein [Bacteroidetes bacterium]|nr:NifB/NifX family molybdenum-iron cluster-binding protein [Bacteroidota bacterium]
MTIAITTTGKEWKDRMDARFGRASGFFLIDQESGNTRYLDNSDNVNAAHGAGPGATQILTNAGVSVLITGNIGPKAQDAIQAAGIRVELMDGNPTVEEAYAAFQRNT